MQAMNASLHLIILRAAQMADSTKLLSACSTFSKLKWGTHHCALKALKSLTLRAALVLHVQGQHHPANGVVYLSVPAGELWNFCVSGALYSSENYLEKWINVGYSDSGKASPVISILIWTPPFVESSVKHQNTSQPGLD